MTDTETYLATLENSQQKIIKKIIAFITIQVPSAELRLSYGMPCFYYKTRYLLGIAGFNKHMSIFPGPEPIEKLQEQLQNYKTSKGTIQFTKEHQLSDDLLKKIIELCIERIEK